MRATTRLITGSLSRRLRRTRCRLALMVTPSTCFLLTSFHFFILHYATCTKRAYGLACGYRRWNWVYLVVMHRPRADAGGQGLCRRLWRICAVKHLWYELGKIRTLFLFGTQCGTLACVYECRLANVAFAHSPNGGYLCTSPVPIPILLLAVRPNESLPSNPICHSKQTNPIDEKHSQLKTRRETLKTEQRRKS